MDAVVRSVLRCHRPSLILAPTCLPFSLLGATPQPWLITFSVNEDIKLSAAAATAAEGNKHSSNINNSSNNQELPLFCGRVLVCFVFFSTFVYFYSHKKVALPRYRH